VFSNSATAGAAADDNDDRELGLITVSAVFRPVPSITQASK